MKLRLRLGVPEHGWLDVRLDIGDEEVVIDASELEEYEAFVAEMGDVPWSDVHVLIHDNSDFWVTHPHKTNPHGLPTLVCLGHDDPDNPDGALTTPHNPGAQFLNMLATLLG